LAGIQSSRLPGVLNTINSGNIPYVVFTEYMKIKTYLALVLFTLCLFGCGRKLDWAQEAPLYDGRILVVERHSEFGPSFPGNSGMEITQILAFRHPDTGNRISWHIPEGLLPVMIDFDKGTPYYVLTEYTISDYNTWGCPNPPYLVYRYEQGKWTRIAFEELPQRFLARNLVDMSKGINGIKNGQYVSVYGLENHWNKYPKNMNVRQISRKKINPIAQGCYESTLHKQGRQSEIDNRR
jgi:hypothetical protein